jgi:hypothetical protein
LLGSRGQFERTPKSGGARSGGRYRPLPTRLWWIELLLGIYCGSALWIYFSMQKWLIGLFLSFYTLGYFALGWASCPWRARSTDASHQATPSVDELPSDLLLTANTHERPEPSHQPV